MSLTSEPSPIQIAIDREKCRACGHCTLICPEGTFSKKDDHIEIVSEENPNCIVCGQCIAACPADVISITGPGLCRKNIVELPPKESRADPTSLYNLMLSRRSIRHYQDKPVERDIIDQILKAASTAPVGIPPSSTRVLIWEGKEKVQEAAKDFLASMRRMQWMFSKPMLTLMRPFMQKETYQMMKGFVAPLMQYYLEGAEQNHDFLFYNAPLAMYFCAKSTADGLIASAYAMLAAESLGLGSCMIGFPPRLFERDKKLREKYNIPHYYEPGILLILGRPKIPYQRAVTRDFNKVQYC